MEDLDQEIWMEFRLKAAALTELGAATLTVLELRLTVELPAESKYSASSQPSGWSAPDAASDARSSALDIDQLTSRNSSVKTGTQRSNFG